MYSGMFEINDPRNSSLVGLDRLYAAIIDGEFLEVGQDTDRQLGGPCVAPQLKGRSDGLANIDRWLLGFNEETPRAAAGAETVVGCFCASADANGIFVDYFLVGIGIALAVKDVPAEGLEQRINELFAELGLIVLAP